jgi:hypothetical protein
LHDLACLCVPRLGDWCCVHIFEEGELRSLAEAHYDDAKTPLVRDLTRNYMPHPDVAGGLHEALRTQRPILHREIPPSLRNRFLGRSPTTTV